MSGPISQIIKLLAKKSGKSLGKTVAKDIKAAEAPWTLAEMIKELASDSGLSKSYIIGLIAKSGKTSHLQDIRRYLTSVRAGNLTAKERYNLATTIEAKIKKNADFATFKKKL